MHTAPRAPPPVSLDLVAEMQCRVPWQQEYNVVNGHQIAAPAQNRDAHYPELTD